MMAKKMNDIPPQKWAMSGLFMPRKRSISRANGSRINNLDRFRVRMEIKNIISRK